MIKTHDLIILGDGIVARALSRGAAKIGLDAVRIAPTILTYENDPRTYAIAPSNLRMLSRLDADIDATQISDVAKIEFAFGDIMPERRASLGGNGTLMHMIDHNVIALGLSGDAHINDEAGDVSQDEHFAYLPAHNLRARVVVVADGKNSPIPAALGISMRRDDYEQDAITAKMTCSEPHGGIARQLFTPNGPMGILPHGTHDLSLVWSIERTRAQVMVELDDVGFARMLNKALGDVYGDITVTSPRHSFPLVHVTPSRLSLGRVVLTGDSAHGIHPMAGQGLNLGLRDVACLLHAIGTARRIGMDIGMAQVISDYETSRRGDIARLTHLTRGLHKLGTSGGVIAELIKSVATKSLASGGELSRQMAEFIDAPLDPLPELLR